MGRPIVQISLKDFATLQKAIAAELWTAATETGFFYLKDHDLTAVFAPHESNRGFTLCRNDVIARDFAQPRINRKR